MRLIIFSIKVRLILICIAICLINTTKKSALCEFGHIYRRNSEQKTYFLVQCNKKPYFMQTLFPSQDHIVRLSTTRYIMSYSVLSRMLISQECTIPFHLAISLSCDLLLTIWQYDILFFRKRENFVVIKVCRGVFRTLSNT